MIIVAFYRKIGLMALWMGMACAAALVLAHNTYDIQGLLIVSLGLCILAVFMIRRMSRGDDRWLLAVLALGLVAKLGASLFRYFVAVDVYGGVADATGYDGNGRIIAEHLRNLEFSSLALYTDWGTHAMTLVTGVIYALVGPTFPGAYLVFAFLAFLGAYAFYRAFRLAFPSGNHKFFAVLVFLYPSLLFWPNGMSKDAVVFFFMGLATYGGASLLRRISIGGGFPLVAGCLGLLMIRPHIAGILAMSFATAFGLRSIRQGLASPLPLAFGLVMSIALALYFVPRALQYTGLGTLDLESTLSYLEMRQSQTLQGGSAFQAPSITSPMGFPVALITVLFRPFPWEAHNLQALVQALDGLLLLLVIVGILVWRLPTVFRNTIAILGHPFAIFLILYTVIFVVAFTSISNFGILARQRSQLLPFFMMLVVFLASKRVRPEPSRTGP